MTVPMATEFLFSFSRRRLSSGTTVCGKRLLFLFQRDMFAGCTPFDRIMHSGELRISSVMVFSQQKQLLWLICFAFCCCNSLNFTKNDALCCRLCRYQAKLIAFAVNAPALDANLCDCGREVIVNNEKIETCRIFFSGVRHRLSTFSGETLTRASDGDYKLRNETVFTYDLRFTRAFTIKNASQSN